ncbi:DUF4126 domain-containing protein [Dyella soli]|uniref:DUF4126 domain-containing protein n=1 Tax=Dyella soli TaxID=522319 RepID=A0A4R0YX21_9GAMM|nr:DUF4126 domain-containing protein [Dyella soli]TCI11488.1 DUF4126 domain-containing protein [Dyella soli]
MDTLQSIALAGGLSWASGLRLYATVFITGLLARLGFVHLPDGLSLLTDNWVLAVAGVLAVGELLADKLPAFDSVWDAVHTFIRIPAGTLLAWGVFRDSGPGVQLAAALLGGALVSGTHLAKTGSRALVNTSPEPLSNWSLSLGEDVSWLGGLYLMWQHPALFLALLLLFVLCLLWLLPKIVRGLRALARRLRGLGASSSNA